MKFKPSEIHKTPDYLEYLEECRRICNRIYMCRNVILNGEGILEELKKIDKLPGHKCFKEEENEFVVEVVLPDKILKK